MTERHLAHPGQGALEFQINTGLERDGIGQRICLHADRTVRELPDGVLVLECDYCPAAAGLAAPHAALPDLPAWYWRTPAVSGR